MAMDPLEKERLRRKMALRMGAFLENSKTVVCVSGHYNEQEQNCELCQSTHARELLVIKNRAGKKMHVAVECLKEMVRFQVADVDELPRWLEKIGELEKESIRRKAEMELQRNEERKRLEKKVIVRKRDSSQVA